MEFLRAASLRRKEFPRFRWQFCVIGAAAVSYRGGAPGAALAFGQVDFILFLSVYCENMGAGNRNTFEKWSVFQGPAEIAAGKELKTCKPADGIMSTEE